MRDAHPLNVGVPGACARDCANRVLVQADVVMFIGIHPGGQVTNNWMFPPPGTKVMQLDIDPAEVGRNYPNTVSILGDAKVSLRRMIDAGSPKAATGWTQHTAGLVANWRRENSEILEADFAPIRPERVCKEISNALPPNGIVA